MFGFLVLLGVAAAVLFFGITIYNRLVTLRNRFRNAFAQIDVQLQRRHDLIPNVVEAVRGYAKHERETLDEVVRARGEAASALQRAAADPTDAGAIVALSAAEGNLLGRLGRLFGLGEAYPDLKANRPRSSCSWRSSPRPRTGSPSPARRSTTRS